MSDLESSSDEEPNFEDDDEEIDEDAAFTAEDEAKYGSWFEEASDGFDEDEEDGDLESGEDGPEDSLASLNTDEDAASEEDDDSAGREEGEKWHAADEWLAGEDGNDELQEEDDADADAYAQEGSDGDDDTGEKLLAGVVSDGRARKQRVVLNEAVAEDEFAVANDGDAGPALDVASLMAGASLSKSERKALERLASRGQALETALPKRIRQREERKVKYADTSKAVSKWIPIVKANREAPTIRLKEDIDVPRITTAAGLASKHEADNDFEREVAELLKAAGHESVHTVAKAEQELAAKSMTADELAARQNAMARNNALLFYAEIKAKRVKKIKSKAYHRHLKKQTQQARAAADTTGMDDPEELQARAEEAEFQRAKERLTLKHKNTSRWARRALKRGLSLATDDQREAMQEQLRLHRELKAKAASMHDNSDESTDASDEEGSSDGGSDDDGGAKLTAKEKLELAEAVQAGETNGLEQILPNKGLFALPFMRRAVQQEAAEAAAQARELLEAENLLDALPGPSGSKSKKAAGDLIPAPTSTGRLRFGDPPAAAQGGRTSAAAADGYGSEDEDAAASSGGEEEDQEARQQRLRHTERASAQPAAVDTAAPRTRLRSERATATEADTARRRRVHEVGVSMAGVSSVQATAPTTVITAKGSKNRSKAQDADANARTQDAEEPITAGTRRRGAADVNGSSGAGSDGRTASGRTASDDDEGGTGAGDANKEAMLAAFAGDDVMADFEKEKNEAVQESVEAVETPTDLPGWGAWASAKREPKWLTEKKKAAEAEKARRLAARKDAKMKAVVISEKWDKKAQRYTVSSLPFPYKQPDAYEKGMRVPLGRNQNTEASFRELTRPEVIKQTGQIIQPLKLSSSTLDAAAHKKRKGDSVMLIAGGKVKKNKRH